MSSFELISVGVFAVAAVIVGLLAVHLRHVKTAILLVVAGVVALGCVAMTFILRPLWIANGSVKVMHSLEADRTIRELKALPRYDDPKRLTRYEATVFSQGGEDGIIQEIFRRIGTTNKRFCEFGSSDGVEQHRVARHAWMGRAVDGW